MAVYLNLLFIFREVSFLLHFKSTSKCNSIDNVDEGVEFSVRLSSMPEEWIPVSFIHYGTGNNPNIEIPRGLLIRGYTIEPIDTDRDNDVVTKTVVISLCSFNTNNLLQFRWLQTSVLDTFTNGRRDVWTIDDVVVTAVTSGLGQVTLLNETFDSGMLR